MEQRVVAPEHRALVVRAYAHAIMEDLLTDYALEGREPPRTLQELVKEMDMNAFGMRFEETFLQFNAPQWSFGCGKYDDAVDMQNEAVDLVHQWLQESR